jgi:hypothetical protein
MGTVLDTMEFEGVENPTDVRTAFSRSKFVICSGKGRNLKAYVYKRGTWSEPTILNLGEILLTKGSKKCHKFDSVNDIFLSNSGKLYILAVPFVFVRISLNSMKVEEFELLENEMLRHKIAGFYKTTISKGKIMMNMQQDMVIVTA